MATKLTLSMAVEFSIHEGENWDELRRRCQAACRDLGRLEGFGSIPGDVSHFDDLVDALETMASTVRRMRACDRRDDDGGVEAAD